MAKKWYVVHTYSGFENKVKKSLEERVRQQNLQEQFGEVLIPMEVVQEMVKGRRSLEAQVLPRLHPREHGDDARHLAPREGDAQGDGLRREREDAERGPGVSDIEVNRLTTQISEGSLKPKPKVQFEEGDQVRVIDGPFSNFNGTVEEVKPDKGKLRVLVSIFGRATPVETRLHAGGRPSGSRSTARTAAAQWESRVGNDGPSQRLGLETTQGRPGGPEGQHGEVTGQIKLQLPAGKANPAPRGPALGQHGVNIMEFCKQFNAATQAQAKEALIIPVIITVYQDRSFTFVLKTPPAAILLKKAAGLHTEKKGSGAHKPGKEKVGQVTRKQVEQIAKMKMQDMTAGSLEARDADRRGDRPVHGHRRRRLAARRTRTWLTLRRSSRRRPRRSIA